LHEVADMLKRPWSAATRLWILRRLKAREQSTGRTLLWREQEKRGGVWRTTEPALEDAFPEFYSRRDDVAIALGDEHERLKKTGRVALSRIDALAAEVVALKRELSELRRAVA
jgi:hypothetical protein